MDNIADILYRSNRHKEEKILKSFKKKKFMNDEAAGYIVDMIIGSMPNLKKAFDKYDINPKGMIRFKPVSEMCQNGREKKGLAFKQIALSLKVPQYRLKDIESSSVKNIKVDILEKYIDYLGLRDWFKLWKKHNLDVYNRLLKKEKG